VVVPDEWRNCHVLLELHGVDAVAADANGQNLGTRLQGAVVVRCR
jgi:hypothetical protein